MHNDETESGRAVFTFRRREFLVMGSAAAVGLAATSLKSDTLSDGSTPMPLLSVGYWNGSPDELTRDAGRRHLVVPADRLVAGDDSLANETARVTVHGFWRGAAHREPLTLGLRAHYAASEIPVIAWSWRPGMRAANQVKLEMPVGETLDFTLERMNSQPLPTRRIADWMGRRKTSSRAELAPMTSRSGAPGIKLRRGVYFFAVREHEGEAIPSWSATSVVSRPDALDANGPLANASFSYLMLSIA